MMFYSTCRLLGHGRARGQRGARAGARPRGERAGSVSGGAGEERQLVVYIAGGTNRELSCDAVVRVPLLSKIARDYTPRFVPVTPHASVSISRNLAPHGEAEGDAPCALCGVAGAYAQRGVAPPHRTAPDQRATSCRVYHVLMYCYRTDTVLAQYWRKATSPVHFSLLPCSMHLFDEVTC